MSVDFAARVTISFSVGALMTTAGEIVARLLGLPDVLLPEVRLGRERHMGLVTTRGRQPREGELDRMLLGPRPDPTNAWPAIDIIDRDGNDLVVPFESRSSSGGWRVVFTPRRDQAGIVWGLAFALAAARLGRGQLIDDDLRLTDPPITDPDVFVAAVRKPANETSGFDAAARGFIAQFKRGWPAQ
jgi:hypothetical protein